MSVFDLALVGSGFGGALLAMVARRRGRSVVLIEKGSHPRFAIGESTSPLTNLLIEEIARRYDLPRLLPLTAWGAWKRAYPQVTVGLKRGFTYYSHRPGAPFSRCPDRSDRLVVAASPGEPCADTHWLRADVDRFLLEEARALGAAYRERTTIEDLTASPEGWRLTCRRAGETETVRARFLVDATGPGGFLARWLGLKEVGFSGFPETRSLYSHFVGVRRTDEMREFADPGAAPYPADDAALHHVFPGGWMWALRFDPAQAGSTLPAGQQVTSAGIAVEGWLADELHLAEGNEAAWSRFLARFPGIAAQFADATPVQPWFYAPRLAFRRDRAAGCESGCPWALLPSAAGFIDPLYSTGFPLTLLGVQRLVPWLEEGQGADYEAATFAELDWVARYIGANYAAFADFPRFIETSFFYFAAASFSEMARRLGRAERAPGYLFAGNDPFRAAFERWRTGPGVSVAEAIAPWNVAGLADPARANAYPADLAEVVRSAGKLGETPETMRAILAEAEWARC